MIAMLLLAGAVVVAQAGPPPAQAPTTENRAPVPVQPPPASEPAEPGVDKLFAVAAMQGNAAEIDMANLAMRRGTANEVKMFAGMMLADHGGMMREMLPALRRVLGAAAPPQRLAPPDALAMRHLEAVPAVDFDQSYVMQQIGDHLATLAAFQTEADNGSDPQLKALARTWLPTIQSHLELAVDVTKHVGGSSPFKSH